MIDRPSCSAVRGYIRVAAFLADILFLGFSPLVIPGIPFLWTAYDAFPAIYPVALAIFILSALMLALNNLILFIWSVGGGPDEFLLFARSSLFWVWWRMAVVVVVIALVVLGATHPPGMIWLVSMLLAIGSYSGGALVDSVTLVRLFYDDSSYRR